MSPTGTLHQRHQTNEVRRRLGKIGSGAFSPAGPARAPLRLAHPTAPAPTAFPLGAQTRTVDPSGRLKLNSDPRLGEVLGWEPGVLDVVIVDGWAVLRQLGSGIGVKSPRYSSEASYVRSSAGVERITLKPAHIEHLVRGTDRHLLVAAAPSSGALIVVDPGVCLAGAPGVVRHSLTSETSRDPKDQP
ncbi:hypothetical protein HC251_00485 [Iamia sp. SCSIO 61187]|uniref:hypothetical protein n=1 Tax=Iamia sp. SCSIO 61187 TaxID=2722752 RepID=UPI001C628392|nr:hypothetical protein [Iamia sp. SCSIO 61187]QYG91058.1 hypothetical protein HC251_00485 [Iamia sp. SCSIO 61187]